MKNNTWRKNTTVFICIVSVLVLSTDQIILELKPSVRFFTYFVLSFHMKLKCAFQSAYHEDENLYKKGKKVTWCVLYIMAVTVHIVFSLALSLPRSGKAGL